MPTTTRTAYLVNIWGRAVSSVRGMASHYRMNSVELAARLLNSYASEGLTRGGRPGFNDPHAPQLDRDPTAATVPAVRRWGPAARRARRQCMYFFSQCNETAAREVVDNSRPVAAIEKPVGVAEEPGFVRCV